MKTLKTFGLFLAGVLSSLVILSVVHADVLQKFDDVDYDAYYADGLNYFNHAGVINGFDYTHFKPDNFVTRAELVAILKRYDDGLVNAYHNGGVGELVTLICDGFTADDFDDSTVYDTVCAEP